jgi:hypothetical protein
LCDLGDLIVVAAAADNLFHLVNVGAFSLGECLDDELDEVGDVHAGRLVGAVEQHAHQVVAVVLVEARLQERVAQRDVLTHDVYHRVAKRLDLTVAETFGQQIHHGLFTQLQRFLLHLQ